MNKGVLASVLFASAIAVAPHATFAASKGLAAFSQAEMTNEWRVMDTKEMEKAWKDAGYDFVWTDAKSDASKQLADVEDLLARKPKVLIVAPIEYEALAPVPELAHKAGVPLIVVDRTLPGKAGTNGWISVITTDFVDSGMRAANDVVAQLEAKKGGDKGNWVHITGNVGASPVIDQGKGMDEVFASHPGIKLLSKCDSSNSREGGQKCMEDMLQAFPAGKIDVVIADNDAAAIGAISAGSGARTARWMACRRSSMVKWSSPCRRRRSSERLRSRRSRITRRARRSSRWSLCRRRPSTLTRLPTAPGSSSASRNSRRWASAAADCSLGIAPYR